MRPEFQFYTTLQNAASERTVVHEVFKTMTTHSKRSQRFEDWSRKTLLNRQMPSPGVSDGTGSYR